MDRQRNKRWLDFQRRAEYAPAEVYQHRIHGWKYIPLHPFADEPEVLARLGLRPEECLAADAWWAVDGDAALLECRVIGGARRSSGLIFQPRQTPSPRWLPIQGTVDSPYVTRVVFEGLMESAYRAGFPNGARFRAPTERLVLPL